MKATRSMAQRVSFLVLAALPLALGCSGGGGDGPVPPPPVSGLLRVETQTQGLVQVTYADLQTAGFTQGTLPVASLQLTNQGLPVAMDVASANGRTLEAGDAFRFYAPIEDSPYTGTNVFWLSAAGAPTPMAARDGTGASAAAPVGVFQDTLHLEQNLIFNHAAPGVPAADPWFWVKLTAPEAQAFPFQLAGLDEAAGPSSLTVDLLGITAAEVIPDHHVTVSLNGTQVADLTWTGIVEELQTVPLPQGLLQAGANTLTLTLPGDTGASVDQVELNYFEVQSWRPLLAANDVLDFTIPAGNASPVQVGGFDEPGLRVLDITDPANPAYVNPTVATDGAGTYHALFLDPATTLKHYLALAPDQIQAPSALSTWTPGALRAWTQGADYLLITPRAFLEAAQPLLQLRASQGLRAQGVAVEDIFNEFGNGFPDPASIQSFLAYAAANWAPPAPGYVLLLGDATFDYRNYMGTGKLSQVPCHLGITAVVGLTPDDNWFAALDGVDELPSLAIGRLPSATAAQAAQIVQKLVQYETSAAPAPAAALFVAGNEDTGFPALCDELAGMMPSGIAPTKVYMDNYTDFALCTQDLVAALNQGMFLTTYNGHGDVTEWSGELIFNAGDLPLLTVPSQLTFACLLNCENGWFAAPGYYCLAESFVGVPGCGAIGAFACSGLGTEGDHDLVGEAFFTQFFAGGGARIGDICTRAKVAAYREGASMDVVRTYTLIGDPALRVTLPQ